MKAIFLEREEFVETWNSVPTEHRISNKDDGNGWMTLSLPTKDGDCILVLQGPDDNRGCATREEVQAAVDYLKAKAVSDGGK